MALTLSTATFIPVNRKFFVTASVTAFFATIAEALAFLQSVVSGNFGGPDFFSQALGAA